MDPDKLIWQRFRIKPHDSLPFTGWAASTREDLPDLFRELGYTRGAEIGVAMGTFSRLLCDRMPGLHLLCVDPWLAYDRVKQNTADYRYRMTVKRLRHYDAEIKRTTSLLASLEVPDGSLDFVYIDGDHKFDGVMLDLILWAPKVRIGGIVSGHDYYPFYQADVIRAVNTYTEAHGIRQWYLTKDFTPSWLWVRR